jgi:ABC-type proline/glycine betaine transport system permease subunit
MTRKWREELPGAAGLANAGKWIGILERTLILIFLLQNQYAAIGLLITAKGLLRFSEKEKQEQKTEYVLIGSLISVCFSIITGIAVNYLLSLR